jgi:SAM-dependent methyltransferase
MGKRRSARSTTDDKDVKVVGHRRSDQPAPAYGQEKDFETLRSTISRPRARVETAPAQFIKTSQEPMTNFHRLLPKNSRKIPIIFATAIYDQPQIDEWEGRHTSMHANLIQRQYDEVIAAHYDLDPQGLIGDSLDRALAQIQEEAITVAVDTPLRVLDIGMGTGRFLEKLSSESERPIQPFGLDVSARMIEVARTRLPDLVAAVDDAANLDAHFPPEAFDLVSTHFVTGFVPAEILAPKIWSRLAPAGHWSFVGGTKAGFPELQNKADSKALQWVFGGKTLAVDDLVCNPANRADVVGTLERHGFVIRACETFEPPVSFANLNEFLEFAYYGGWLTPFVAALGLHKTNAMVRALMNTFVFPMRDHHNIEIALAQKAASRGLREPLRRHLCA